MRFEQDTPGDERPAENAICGPEDSDGKGSAEWRVRQRTGEVTDLDSPDGEEEDLSDIEGDEDEDI